MRIENIEIQNIKNNKITNNKNLKKEIYEAGNGNNNLNSLNKIESHLNQEANSDLNTDIITKYPGYLQIFEYAEQ